MDYLDRFSRNADGIAYDRLHVVVRTHLGCTQADTVAAIVAGSAEPELRAWSARQTEGGATLVGQGRTAQPTIAALINGCAGTFLEMDEGNRFSRGHPAVHVLPALLASTEQSGANADSFLSA